MILTEVATNEKKRHDDDLATAFRFGLAAMLGSYGGCRLARFIRGYALLTGFAALMFALPGWIAAKTLRRRGSSVKRHRTGRDGGTCVFDSRPES